MGVTLVEDKGDDDDDGKEEEGVGSKSTFLLTWMTGKSLPLPGFIFLTWPVRRLHSWCTGVLCTQCPWDAARPSVTPSHTASAS